MTSQTQPTQECQAIRDSRRPCKEFDGPKMYCNCGCMAPVNLSYDLTNVVVSGRTSQGYADYILTRDGNRVGEVNTQYGTVYLDHVEYLTVAKTSPLYSLVQAALDGKIPQRDARVAEVMTYNEIRDTTEQEQDDRNAHHPGYCRKCHTYCYGDCQA